jgi:putative CocE/NonD family hydrolase
MRDYVMLNVAERRQVATEANPYEVLPVETQSIRMSDGTRLDADIYRPASTGSFPVLLQRQAYGRRIACTICYAHPAWYAAQGYIVVVQDIRGRGTSQGEFVVGENEAADGAETIDWASQLAGSTGDVGMYGFSYQGYNQMLAATAAGRALKALAPAMAPWHAYENWAFENGALRLQGALGWAIQIAAETARHKGDQSAYAELLALSRRMNFNSVVEARPAIMEKYRAYSHYLRWLDTPPDAPYWKDVSPACHAVTIAARGLPMLFTGGWYDTHLASTLRAYSELKALGNPDLYLMVGPWSHFPWTRKVGQVDFGSEAAPDLDQLHIQFFDRYLKGRTGSLAGMPDVRLFDMGKKEWSGFPVMPRQKVTFYLAGDGRVTNDIRAGRMLDNFEDVAANTEFVVHDPWRPAPSIGGAFGSPPGPVDRSVVDLRGDVAAYTTPPLETEFTLAGAVRAVLNIKSDTPSFDVNCVLSRVATTGQVIPLCEGHARIRSSGERSPIVISMRATCATIRPGEALRLSIAGASFPAFPVNPGNGNDPTRAARAEALITTLAINCGGSSPSLLEVTVSETACDDPKLGEEA